MILKPNLSKKWSNILSSTFVAVKIIHRKLCVQIFHDAISSNFGNNAGRRDAGTDWIPLDDLIQNQDSGRRNNI